MTLTTEFIHHADIAKAAHEALVNAERLRLAGYFAEAFEICSALTRRGPWECSKAGQNYSAASARLPTLAWLNHAICPALPDEPRRTPAELTRWAKQSQRDAFARLVISDRLQIKPAGTGWTRETLERLPLMKGPSGELGQFINDLDWVLNDRVRHALRAHPPELLAGTGSPVRTSAPIDVSKDARSFEHDYLMDVLHRCVEHIGGGGYLGERCLMYSVVLDLAASNTEPAVARLRRWSASLLTGGDYPIRHWDPYVAILRGHALAGAFALDDINVQVYMAAFRARPEGLVATTLATIDWAPVLRKFCEQRSIQFSDERRAKISVGMLEHHAPRSQTLIDRAKRHEFTSAGLDDTEIEALEARLGERLPPSYRSFLQTTNGLFSGGSLSMLPATDIDWFRNLEPNWIEVWNDYDQEATDEQYATYGPDQDCIHMRPRHLRTALQVSTTIDGDVLLLVPAVRFGDEWEAWFFGNKNPGAFRYRSFAEMMDETIFKRVRSEF